MNDKPEVRISFLRNVFSMKAKGHILLLIIIVLLLAALGFAYIGTITDVTTPYGISLSLITMAAFLIGVLIYRSD